MPDARLIDVRQRDREHVIGCWDLGGALVDPGPESRMATLLDALDEAPRALLLTHVHLDHAGGAGALVERFPELDVWVHARGAPHLVDPAKLLASARRIYGDDLERLWGRVVPVPESNVRVLEGGETVRVAGRELDAEYTPGHASHHVVYFDRSDDTAYVGDVAGVRIPPSSFVRMPTPPPDIDVEAWEGSIDLVASRDPAQLALTHFGWVEEPATHLEEARRKLHEQAGLVRELLGELGDGEEAVSAFADRLTRLTRDSTDPGTAAVFEVGAPVEQLWYGLRRYWDKKQTASER
jgi:glyoxylase-like metal-dependent hydrolase (beta-lactamase superfamily II)